MQNYPVNSLFDCLYRPDDGVIAIVGDVYWARGMLIAGAVLVALSLPLFVWVPLFGCRARGCAFFSEHPIHANVRMHWHNSRVKLEPANQLSIETREKIAANAVPDKKVAEIPLGVRENIAANI